MTRDYTQKELKLKMFYDATLQYLEVKAEASGISRDDLKVYFTPESSIEFCKQRFGEDLFSEDTKIAFNSIQSVFCQIFISLQNSGYRNFVNLDNKEQAQVYRKALCDFNPHEVKNRYNKADELFEEIISELNLQIIKESTKEKAWKDFLTGVYNAAKYLSEFKSKHEFVSSLKEIKSTGNEEEKIVKSLLKVKKKHEIKGLGEALSSDFLKDSGIIDCGKPDVHILKVLSAEGIDMIDNDTLTKGIWDQVHTVLGKIADASESSIYQIDRIIWLICTENFFLHTQGSKRNNYIKKMTDILST